jgi:choline dehydrogenase-like flavoprotein
VERTLHVAQQPLDVLGRNGRLALLGAERLGWQAAPLRRNAPGCEGSSQCAVGCPVGAKNGVHLNALPQACEAGARILTRATVQRVLVEGGRATGVRALRPDGSWLEVLAPVVVVAAGAVETPVLLRRSGLAGHPRVGRGLAVHPAISIAGRFEQPVVAWSGVLQSVGIEELHDEGILIEATGTPPGMGSFLLPGVGRALRDQVARADHLALLGAMIADAPSGRVRGRSRALVTYDLSDGDAARLRKAVVAMGRVLFAAGAQEVLTGLPGRPVARDVTELAEAVARTPSSGLHLAAFHPTGTVAMGRDPQTAPADAAGRLRGVRGVYVADASVLPTCPSVNPQLSIMAMALGVAEVIVTDTATTTGLAPLLANTSAGPAKVGAT